MNRKGNRASIRSVCPLILCLGSLIFAHGLAAQEAHPSVPDPQVGAVSTGHYAALAGGRKSIGLALEGGGALGIAHVGVLKWMYVHHVPVDRVAGTSMGALVGSLVASGYSPDDIERLVSGGNFDDLFTLKPSLSKVSFRQREQRDTLPQALTLGLRDHKVSIGSALIADDQLNAFLAHELVAYNSGSLKFDDLPIPFRCVATDLTTLNPKVFRSGSLPFAVRASISIPGVFPPINDNGHLLVDGAIVDNLPTDVLRNELHADVVIAVHLSDAPFDAKDGSSLLGIFARAFQAGTNRNEQISRSLADLEILPEVSTFVATDYSKAAALEKAGYDAAEKQRDRLLPYALGDAEWEAYLSSLRTSRRAVPKEIKVVKVEGADRATSAKIAQIAEKLANKPFDPARAEAKVAEVRGGGALDAYYETFNTTPAETPNQVPEPDDGILLHWRPKVEGPPYLLLGSDVVAMNSNVSSAIFDVRLLDQNLGGYGSELLSDVRVGYLTQLDTEYYKPIGIKGFFVQPRVELIRQPVYFWADQKRVSERFLQRAGGGFEIGTTLSRNFQTGIEYRVSTIHWNLLDGVDDSPNQHLSGMTHSIAVHTFYSNRVAEIASPHGSQIDLTVGHILSATSSRDAPFMTFAGRQSFSLAQKNVISLSAEAHSYFRSVVADPLRFTLGGPLRLYASSIDEYRGTDTALVRGMYLRRIASLPTGLGQGIYLTGGYEAGSIWSPERHSILRQDVVGGFLLSTPLGAITVGGALGDDGHRKVFFTFGKLFQ